MQQDDKRVVEQFVERRRNRDLPGVQVDCWPDLENRDSSDIDALAGPLAIEHTSVDTVADQRRDGAWFMNVVEPLERAATGTTSFRLEIIFPYDGITRGQDWALIRDALQEWLLRVAPSLPEGPHTIRIPAMPFAFEVVKASDRSPGVFFMRYSPEGQTLADRLRLQITRKASKLVTYRANGKRGVLLLESNDIALMNTTKLVDAIRSAFPEGLPSAVDELWYADTSVPGAQHDFHNLTHAIGRAV
jgi:hypothetical protein